MIRQAIRYLAIEHGRAVYLFRRFCRPDGREWAEYLRRHSELHHVGLDCTISPSAVFTDPGLTSIGDRACLGACTIICHDGSIEMLEQAYGVKLDRIGTVTLERDVYVGQQAIIVGIDGVTIGAGSIIGAGAVVRSSVPAGSIVIGNPGKVVGLVGDLARFWEDEFRSTRWDDIILDRDDVYGSEMERYLASVQQAHFFRKIH